MLASIKAYLQAHQQANLMALAKHLGVAPDAMKAMLDVWIRKGCVKAVDAPGCGTTCQQCVADFRQTYQWIG